MKFSRKRELLGSAGSGLGAGILNGLFGGGGGLLLIPGLRYLAGIEESRLFSLSVSVMLPVCLLSIGLTAGAAPLPWREAWPYLAGSALGGVLAGVYGSRIPVLWLHRALGLTLIWGGVRYLW